LQEALSSTEHISNDDDPNKQLNLLGF